MKVVNIAKNVKIAKVVIIARSVIIAKVVIIAIIAEIVQSVVEELSNKRRIYNAKNRKA